MPFKSKAQRRKFAQLLVEGKITDEQYEEWNRSTGSKELPERVNKSAAKKRATGKKAPKRRAAKMRATKAPARKSSPRKPIKKGARARPARRRAAKPPR